MTSVASFVFLLAISSISLCSGQIDEGCKDIFQFYHNETSDEWYGFGQINNVKDESFRLNVKLRSNSPENFFSANPGKLNIIKRGETVYYFAFFTAQSPLPELHSISFNSDIICNNITQWGFQTSFITLIEDYPQMSTASMQISTTQRPSTTTQKRDINVSCGLNGTRCVDTGVTQCGTLHPQLTFTLPPTKGDPIEPGTWPWLVAVYRRSSSDALTFLCGGSLVAERLVVTAAHCLFHGSGSRLRVENIAVILGKNNLRIREEGEKKIYPSNLHIHNDYRFHNPDADIAVLVLPESVEFTKFIRPICLSNTTSLRDMNSRKSIGAGWSLDDQGEVVSPVPQWAGDRPILNNTDCRQFSRRYRFTKRTFCTGWGSKATGICQGNGGGGLAMKVNGQWVLRGVISTFIGANNNNCDHDAHTIFTDVFKFTYWIKSFNPKLSSGSKEPHQQDTTSGATDSTPSNDFPVTSTTPKPQFDATESTTTPFFLDTQILLGLDESDIEFFHNSEPYACGTLHPSVNSTIPQTGEQGEEIIDRGTWPWLVAVLKKTPTSLTFLCSGSLISERLVVTAANCFQDETGVKLNVDDIALILGKHNLGTRMEEGGSFLSPLSLTLHPAYNRLNSDADIAVLVTSEPVEFTELIHPICLWNTSDSEEINNRVGVAAGWKKDPVQNIFYGLPYKIKVPFVTNYECRISNQHLTTDRTFCVGWRNGTSGICQEDSGAGFALNVSGRWVLRGVMSKAPIAHPDRCNLNKYPVFSDVSKFVDWIWSHEPIDTHLKYFDGTDWLDFSVTYATRSVKVQSVVKVSIQVVKLTTSVNTTYSLRSHKLDCLSVSEVETTPLRVHLPSLSNISPPPESPLHGPSVPLRHPAQNVTSEVILVKASCERRHVSSDTTGISAFLGNSVKKFPNSSRPQPAVTPFWPTMLSLLAGPFHRQAGRIRAASSVSPGRWNWAAPGLPSSEAGQGEEEHETRGDTHSGEDFGALVASRENTERLTDVGQKAPEISADSSRGQRAMPKHSGAPPNVPQDISKLSASQDGQAPCRILDKILEHGKEWTHPEKCVNYFCYDGKILEVDFCDPLKTTGPNCVIIPIRPNLDYPYCCPKASESAFAMHRSSFVVPLVIFLSIFVETSTRELPDSPCPEIFRYRYNVTSRQWYGWARIKNITEADNFYVYIKFDVNVPKDYEFVNEGRLEFSISENVLELSIDFPLQSPMPELSFVNMNSTKICQSSHNSKSGWQCISHFLQRDENYDEMIFGTPSKNTVVRTNRTQSTRNTLSSTDTSSPGHEATPIRNMNGTDADKCGTLHPLSSATGLVARGDTIRRGTWPWLVGVFSYNGAALSFTCGASLISDRLVLTAAHCFFRNTGEKILVQDVVLILGKYDLRKPDEDGAKIVYPSTLKLHNDYTSYILQGESKHKPDADIAVLIMPEPVEFTQFIRPICLWKPTDPEISFNESGIAAGWGMDESGNVYTQFPRWIQIPIVANSVCRRSNQLFQSLLTERTLCVGWKNGISGVCGGDSGGGFAFYINGRWVLRGLISTSLPPTKSAKCNLDDYTIFVDVSKFLDWIQSYDPYISSRSGEGILQERHSK
ncbi:uncharacterized protein LOC132257743 [Phlebotomus argentipes]|uniref:uncharacterized protein LOC132257743 n=1 Tax=Phlebotomus argentipes TaxID=94469 RepID=UPI002892F3AD|nr:uncharacterized protein LOC132257743 [Phlebotomus argentipes]